MRADEPARRWKRLKEVFSTAASLAEPDRTAFLDRACRDDDALRSEVEALLCAHEEEGKLDAVQVTFREMLESEDRAPDGPRRVGPYEIVRRIGDGGMGEVYLARRADGQFDHQVALKLVRSDFRHGAGSQRFLDERQILAHLNHPNIAQLLDGGLTDDGVPYFAMEYVEGRPIDQFCSVNGLSVPRRLELFLGVCDAVEYAHRSLIVHRDLKPANILVSRGGRVKLLDFGIAKLLDRSPGIRGDLTRTGLLPMTPACASPEQVRGEPVTTATDVYQLGVLLYELLAGGPPFEVDGKTAAEMERLICQEIPTRPSSRLTEYAAQQSDARTGVRVEQMLPRVRGDLDTIVLKALRKEPEQRYRSVERFARDVRRHLAHRPIEARPQTLGYRARTFVRRHRWGVVVSCLLVLMVVAYVVTLTWQMNVTRSALESAEREAQRSEQVSQFLMTLFEASDPATARGDTITAPELLEMGLARVRQLDGQPSIQAQMLEVIGQTLTRMGDVHQARAVLTEALRLRRHVHGDDDPETAATRFHLASTLQQAGLYEESIPLLEQALATQRAHLDADNPRIARTLTALGAVWRVQGELDDAVAALGEARWIQQRAAGVAPADLAETLNILGLLHGDLQRWERAERAMRRSIAIRRTTLGDPHPQLAKSLNNLGMLLRKKGDLGAAEPAYREALAVKYRLYGEQHPSIAASLSGLGLLLWDSGRLEEAERHLTEAFEMRRALLGPEHPLVAGSLTNLGGLYADTGRLTPAADSLERARDIFVSSVGATHPHVTYASVGLARVRLRQGRLLEADSLLREAFAIRKEIHPDGHTELEEVRSLLGEALIARGHYAEAQHLLDAAAQNLSDEPEVQQLKQRTRDRLELLNQLRNSSGTPGREGL